MDLEKNPDTRGVSPSLLIILVNCHNTACAFSNILTTSGQSSFATEINHPKYLKEFTIPRGRPYALKALGVTSLSSSADRRLLFHSAPFLHCAMRRFIPFRSRHGSSMSHRGHHGWGSSPPPVSPRYPEHASARNTLAWMSAPLPVHCTHQLLLEI